MCLSKSALPQQTTGESKSVSEESESIWTNTPFHRKCYVLSFSFLELEFLESELLWFTPVVIRSQTVHTIAGGWSACLLHYLRRQLEGPSGLATAVVPLTIQGEHCVIFARLHNLLTDGDGHRVTLDWKGQGSMKPCLKHPNILRKGSDLAHRRPGFYEITHSRAADFQVWSTADVCDSIAALDKADGHVATRAMTKAKFKELEQAVGTASGNVESSQHLIPCMHRPFHSRGHCSSFALHIACQLLPTACRC